MMSDLDPDHIVDEGVQFILRRDERNQALLPELKRRLGMTTPQALQAIKIAKAIREGGRHAA